jgi:DNA-binding MarR family transcriptional regulator
MSSLEERAADLGLVVRDILTQFQILHSAAANGPQSNLGHQDLRAVEQLGENGPQMMRSLAENLGVAVNSMTTIVDNLENKGLAQRMRSDVDRRVVNVELTEEGKRTFELARKAKSQFHRALLAALTEDEQEIMLVLFRKIAREGWKQAEKLSPAPHRAPSSFDSANV